MTYWFAVGQLSCAVVSDGQMEPPLAPPLKAFFTPGTGVATGFAHAAEVAFWSAPGRSPQDDEHRPTALEAIRLFGDRLRPFECGDEVLSQIRAVDAAGHTPGQTAFVLESRCKRLLCAGDTFYDSLQLSHPGWRTPWDHDAERSVLSRRRLLGWAADENLLIHAYHMPFPGLGRVQRHGSAFRWIPVT